MNMIELDARRRTSFGRLGHREHTRYIVEDKQDGTMILTPALVLPATLSPDRIASIKLGIEAAHAGRTRPAQEVLAELGLDVIEDDD